MSSPVSFRPGFEFERTEAELNSAELSWKRGDRAFFAAGACHVLAFAFCARFPAFTVTYVKPRDAFLGTHVFATDGNWSFDHNGVMRVTPFLGELHAAYETRYPGWAADFIAVTGSITEFCHENDHTLPGQFFRRPWDRANRYIDRALLRQAIAGL